MVDELSEIGVGRRYARVLFGIILGLLLGLFLLHGHGSGQQFEVSLGKTRAY